MLLMAITRFLTRKKYPFGTNTGKSPWLTLTKHYCPVADIVRKFSVYETNVLHEKCNTTTIIINA